MSCTKCGEIFEIQDKKSKILWICEFDEINTKIKKFLKKLGLDPTNELGIVCIDTANAKEFFWENIDALKLEFNAFECERIKLHIEYGQESFDYKKALLAKPLQRYINSIDDREFFDILNNESLTSHFQPIVDAKNQTIYGYEMLVRGVKSDGSLMFPDELFSKSKRNDFNFRLDKLCRESALKTAATKKIQQKVFINFIPTSIYDPKFCLQSTQKWANQLEFDPSNIVFEVVETEKTKDQEHLAQILRYYREKGYKIALDDVGEGYSSLNMLIDLQPDIIKIDRKIIQDIDKSDIKLSVYKALYTLAKENGIQVLAEGIESSFEIEAISSIGVDFMQGYYFAKPQAEPIRKL